MDITVIDDSSTDRTARVVRENGCQLLRNESNLGVGRSICRGYQMALEAYIKLWYLKVPRPYLVEVPHPAIYTNTAAGFLNRLYSPANMEDRLDRFGTHALHIVRALQDVAAAGHDDTIICKHIIQWRQHLNQKVLTSTA